jgi:epoxyqueuosine reductase
VATKAPAPLTPRQRADRVKQRARALGFASVGITDLAPVPHADALDRWLEAGYAGTMGYMHRQATYRRDPSDIVPGADRAIVVLYNYYRCSAEDDTGGRIARYAWGLDYHGGLAPALEDLSAFVSSLGDADSIARPYVDAGPVPERELAQRAGLGWIGKNTMLINPQLGSFTFIATILTNVDLDIDAPFEPDRCGSCTRCLEVCPTGAFPAERVLDATRCISYLTIEFRGTVPDDLTRPMGDWVFGCDICQDVCPWNTKFARPTTDRWLLLDERHAWVALDAFDQLDTTDFTQRYGQTALTRPGLSGMRRNAAIARSNRKDGSGE